MSRILVADDEPSIRAILVDVLREHGHQVTEAVDGTMTLEEIGKAAPDLLVIDLVMPNQSGFDVLDALRATRHFPVLAISAITGLKDARYAVAIGADAFLAKPFELKELEDLIAALLAGRPA